MQYDEGGATMSVHWETADELAERVQLKPNTVRKLAREGRIPASRVGTGPKPRLRFDAAAVDLALAASAADLVARSTVESGVPPKIEDPATLSRVASALEDGSR
jgi:excisionase family DNA binding protein